MRKLLILLLLFVLSGCVFAASAADDRVFSEISEHPVFDLSKTLWLPMYSVKWGANNAVDGTYCNDNWMGRLGCALTEHDIIFTIETDGKFVSQSDPTKYRNFYIALRPRCRCDSVPITDWKEQPWKSPDSDYQLGSNGTPISLNDRIPNTKDSGRLVYQVPGISKENQQAMPIDSNGTYMYLSRFFFDVLLCLDELTVDDKQHLASANDYIAVFDVSWTCDDPNCTNPEHHGSIRQIRHGYYDHRAAGGDMTMNLYITPTANARSLDLSALINAQGEAKISDLNVFTTNKGYNPAERLFVFASSNSDYSAEGDEFSLKMNNNSTNTIDFKVIVKNADGTVNKTFLGNDYYGSANTNFLNLSTGVQRTVGRLGDVTYSMVFNSEVFISFEGTNKNTTYATGVYESPIYYHIIYSDGL
ncbi:MAG: hypothetical protein K5634_06580 [Sphaerochaetaceae bacterium]|nr:hypothetical protein [Sphaerochaetaceae bacterium]